MSKDNNQEKKFDKQLAELNEENQYLQEKVKKVVEENKTLCNTLNNSKIVIAQLQQDLKVNSLLTKSQINDTKEISALRNAIKEQEQERLRLMEHFKSKLKGLFAIVNMVKDFGENLVKFTNHKMLQFKDQIF